MSLSGGGFSGRIVINVGFVFQRALATELQNLSMDLRRKQSIYLKRLQQQKEVWNTLGSMETVV
jgi:hypothetical protein